MELLVGWVEAEWSHVGFRTSTQPTRLAAAQRLPAFGRNPTGIIPFFGL